MRVRVPPLDIGEVAELFERIDENILCVFDWVPNEHLDRERMFTLRLKDRFKNKFRNKICRFSDINEAWIEFCSVFQDNMSTVYKLHDIQKKIKMIVDADNYDIVTESATLTSSAGKSVTDGTRNTNSTTKDLDIQGNIGGSGTRSTQDVLWDSNIHRKLLSESTAKKDEEAFMQFLSPTIESFSQNFTKDQKDSSYLSTETSGNTTTTSGINKNDFTNKRRVEAMNQVSALSAAIPKLIANFLECFNVMYYV